MIKNFISYDFQNEGKISDKFCNMWTFRIMSWSAVIAIPYVHKSALSHAIVIASIELPSSSSNSTCHSESSQWVVYTHFHPFDISYVATNNFMKGKEVVYLWNHEVKWTKSLPFRWYFTPCIKADSPISTNQRALLRKEPFNQMNMLELLI